MAILRAKDIAKMNQTEKDSKLKDLRLELIKANVAAKKPTSKTKELKRAIARLLTSNSITREVPTK